MSCLHACPTIGPAQVLDLADDVQPLRAYVVRSCKADPLWTAHAAVQLECCARLGPLVAGELERVVRSGRLVALVTRAPSGLPLATWLDRETRLPFLEAHLVLRDVAAALAAAHTAGLTDGALDAQRVRWTAPRASIEALGVGSLSLPAPLASDDVLAFGRLAFHALTGALPDDATEHSVARRRAHVPPGLARLVMRCLDPEPAARPAAPELDRFLRLLSVPASIARRRHQDAQAEFLRRRPPA